MTALHQARQATAGQWVANALADITGLDDDGVGTPDLVRCNNWALHQLPDRDTVVAGLREFTRIEPRRREGRVSA
jgi:hypothetical protein